LSRGGRKETRNIKRGGYTPGTNTKERINKSSIYSNELAGITIPQTLKIKGYINNNKKLIVLIDLGGTHNFIHFKIVKEMNCFLYPSPKCQVLVANGRSINFSGKFHNINLTMGNYILNSPMLSIPMGGVDVVL